MRIHTRIDIPVLWLKIKFMEGQLHRVRCIVGRTEGYTCRRRWDGTCGRRTKEDFLMETKL